MANICSDNETEIITPINIPGIVGVSIFGIFVIAIIISFFVLKYKPPEKNSFGKSSTTKTTTKPQNKYISSYFYQTVFGRAEGFLGGSFSILSVGLVISIMLYGVVGAFNALIISPIVQVSIPNQEIFRQGIDLGRNVWFYPGQFVFSLIGFIISLFIIFMFIEMIYQISKLPMASTVLKYLFMIIIIGLILALVVWNMYDVATPKIKCVPKGAAGMLSSEKEKPVPPITPTNMFINPHGGVLFSI